MPNRLILIADDSSDDLFLLRRAFAKAGIINPVREVRSGTEAIAYLNGEGEFADRKLNPLPGIIFLDLHMLNGDGFGVLAWLKEKFAVRGILVIVLTGANEIDRINRAYALGANSFLTKPGEPQQLEELSKVFHDYWILRDHSPAIETA